MRGRLGQVLGESRALVTAASAVFVALLLGGGVFVWASSGGTAGATEVFLEPAASVGENPFQDLDLFPVPTIAPAVDLFAKAGSGGVRALNGDTVGLYGGTLNNSVCDRDQMISFLSQNSGQAAAWAGTQGIATSELASYIRGLTPVQLRLDTRVTNHGYVDGRATARQSVLEAGTAVLVDRFGVPRARCYCGNPLLPPVAVDKPTYVGKAWPSFDDKALARVTAGASAEAFTLHDASAELFFDRPVGTDGSEDRARGGASISPSPKTPPSTPLVDSSTPSTAPEVSVPDAKGKPEAEATEAMKLAGLSVSVTYIDVPAGQGGKVESQDPEAGKAVKRGSRVALVVGKDAAAVPVPDVGGKTEDDAAKQLKDAGFVVNVRYVDVARGTGGKVVDQSPTAGAQVNKGSSVFLVVGRDVPAVTVPNVVNRSEGDATSALRDAGLVVKVSYVDVPRGEGGAVRKQSPAAGQTADRGATVTLEVGRDEAAVTVPGVLGASQADATAALQQAGFTVTVVNVEVPRGTGGKVIDQSPIGGAQVNKGSGVRLTVGKDAPGVTVPDTVGRTESAARTQLEGSGLVVTVSYTEVARGTGGKVMSQSPGAGATVDRGSTVALVVGRDEAGVTVPDLVGMTEADARSRLEGLGLRANVTTAEVARGTGGKVLRHDPRSGAVVNRGSTVTIVVGRDAPGVTVPNLVGQSESEARSQLKNLGLDASVQYETVARGTGGKVLRHTPGSGTVVDPRSSVTVVVGQDAPGVTVPNVLDRPEAEAVRTLRGLGLVPQVSYVEVARGTGGNVVQQGPQAGTVVDPGATVNLRVGVEPNGVSVPGVLGQTESRALATLEEAGLRARVSYEETGRVQPGTVLQQNPVADTVVDPGSTVSLVVAVAPTTVVPNLVELSVERAQAALKNAGLQFSGKPVRTDNIACDTTVVYGQDPAAGARVPVDTVVTVEYWEGYPCGR
ncbi:MAG: PASTA domain-containing protein [Acidimicrobiia bacterium]|nr:PASTA domain-containing protein [Acidimicrobiia bacterium]